jgi:hypothetical protein
MKKRKGEKEKRTSARLRYALGGAGSGYVSHICMHAPRPLQVIMRCNSFPSASNVLPSTYLDIRKHELADTVL